MNASKLIMTLFFSIISFTMFAQTGKPIRGIVIDNSSGELLEASTVVVLNINPQRGVMTDFDGEFFIDKLPIGRYDIQASFLGYEPMIIREVMVSSAKDVHLTFSLKENLNQLGEIVVKPTVNKQEPINNLALASARMLSVEEANRYAGGFDDPARLVSSFAGVAGSVSSNAIAVRGNCPQSLQWKLEGMEVPNPTHFPDITGLGGGVITALSSQVLGNSDFFTGAFPSEYSNALSGVFDMQMREGNRWERESTFQIGTMGIDFGSEGPFKKGGQASYLFNYRYATMALLSDIAPDLIGAASGMRYQDLSFKLNFPSKKIGTISVWGIGLIDNYKKEYEEDLSEWETRNDQMEINHDRTMGAGGIVHKIFLNNNTYLKSSLGATYNNNHSIYYWHDVDLIPIKTNDMQISNTNIVFNSYLNKKYSSKHTNRTGIAATGLFYNLDYNRSPRYATNPKPMENFGKEDGNTMLLSAFTNSSVKLSSTLTVNVGINSQYFLLNKELTLEPRLGLRIQAAPKHTFGFAYGNHSRHERLEYYFVKTPETNNEHTNKDLKLSRANHFVLSYDWTISDNLHLKIEPYYQQLCNIPVARDSSFSIINHNQLQMKTPLVSEGKGRNYGVDITLERYLADGYYYLFTGSIFDSRYKGGDGVWRNTRLNRRFLFNALGGREWALGKNKQNILGVNLRISYQGGDRYSPIDEAKSLTERDDYYDEHRAFENQYDPALMTDITINYKMNKKKVVHDFSLKLLNVNMYEEPLGYDYNLKTGQIEEDKRFVFMPNISYKIQF